MTQIAAERSHQVHLLSNGTTCLNSCDLACHVMVARHKQLDAAWTLWDWCQPFCMNTHWMKATFIATLAYLGIIGSFHRLFLATKLNLGTNCNTLVHSIYSLHSQKQTRWICQKRRPPTRQFVLSIRSSGSHHFPFSLNNLWVRLRMVSHAVFFGSMTHTMGKKKHILYTKKSIKWTNFQ